MSGYSREMGEVGGRRRRWESSEEKKMRKLVEQQRAAQGVQEAKQIQANMNWAKKQILEAESSADLLARAESLIEEDWLGQIDAMPGNMFYIGAFGDLTQGTSAFDLKGLKMRARLLGCISIAGIQVFGPPAIFFSTTRAWGVMKDKAYMWDQWDPSDPDNSLADWNHVKATKVLGTMFLFCFILNGLFVVLDEKQAWFKIYNIFQYLKRNTPKYDVTGITFLYLGALVNCWTVLWCCLSSYVVVGGSESPKDVLFDSLGLLFLYNLDDIGGDLGFVDEDDWPGVRLGWIFAEMVKKNWSPADEEAADEASEPEILPCKKGCGRFSSPGLDANGNPYQTCCRGCAFGGAHDEDCRGLPISGGIDGPTTEDYVGGETSDWNCGGWLVLAMYHLTIFSLTVLTFALPVLSAYTPFTKIVPDD